MKTETFAEIQKMWEDSMTLKSYVIGMEMKNLFKWKHYQPDITLLIIFKKKVYQAIIS
ncbi:hypothetical protein [Bacillus thuringiensis]|uniref:hypothetical protein n=1 Tax=Bacillus thuringiensis TaxID=1428 RepID=UPI0015CF30AE|nr:hypothetical protein [Bacillus thuringiensis]